MARLRRRRGLNLRPGDMSPALRNAVRDEAARLADIDDPVQAVTAVSDVLAALNDEIERIAAVRLEGVRTLRRRRWSYDRIAEATGLSKSRAAQLSREVRGRGRREPREPA